jgi:hypothetical protein
MIERLEIASMILGIIMLIVYLITELPALLVYGTVIFTAPQLESILSDKDIVFERFTPTILIIWTNKVDYKGAICKVPFLASLFAVYYIKDVGSVWRFGKLHKTIDKIFKDHPHDKGNCFYS